jgi:hypothetical protein
MTTITIPLSDEQITHLANGNSIVLTQPAIMIESKSKLDLLKEKYATGNYIGVWNNKFNPPYKWVLAGDSNDSLLDHSQYKLIHIKHKPILDAYLADNSVEIELHSKDNLWFPTNFIDKYDEDFNYRLKPQIQYPIYKRNSDGEVFRFDEIGLAGICVFGIELGVKSGKVILENDYNLIDINFDSTHNLYHLQPVWFTNAYKYTAIGFYNVINNNVFNSNGISWTKGNIICNDIKPITSEQLKTMPFIWDMYQQVLKNN